MGKTGAIVGAYMFPAVGESSLTYAGVMAISCGVAAAGAFVTFTLLDQEMLNSHDSNFS
jgi:energy-converting hydrogenase Eha subunit H